MTIVFKASPNIQKMMLKFYQDHAKDNPPAYSQMQAILDDCVITLYESGKVMFQGIGADNEGAIWIEQEKHLNNRVIDLTKKDKKDKDEQPKHFYNVSTIGSDEVGTGDYFGPIVVTATYVSKENISYFTEIGVRDSKKLTDDKIKEIAPLIIKKIPYVTYILDNHNYNNLSKDNLNMNKIKAVLHNKVLMGLII